MFLIRLADRQNVQAPTVTSDSGGAPLCFQAVESALPTSSQEVNALDPMFYIFVSSPKSVKRFEDVKR